MIYDFDDEDRALIAEARAKALAAKLERRQPDTYGRRQGDRRLPPPYQPSPGTVSVSARTREKWLLRCGGNAAELPRTICGLPIIYGKELL